MALQRGLLRSWRVKIDFFYCYDPVRSCTGPVYNKEPILERVTFADFWQNNSSSGRDVRRPKKDYSNQLRTDRRCGPRFRKNGKPGECDPDSLDSCCNEERGVCGNSAEDCDCGDKCVDYWLKREWKHILEERKQIEKERPLKDGEYWDDLFTIVGTEESIDDVI